METIDSFKGANRWLSNFWPSWVRYGGIDYPSVENAYQAAKFQPMHREKFITCTAAEAKRYGKNAFLDTTWHLVKYSIMKELVKQKFNDEDLAKLLISTGDTELIEGNTWGDTFWGVCKGKGENNLGRILMDIRKDLVSSTHTKAFKGKVELNSLE